MRLNLLNISILTTALISTTIYGIRYLPNPKERSSTTKPSKDNSTKLSEKPTVVDISPKLETNDILTTKTEDKITDLNDNKKGQKLIEKSYQSISEVYFANGLLTINITNEPLSNVLEQISSKTGITISTEAIEPNHNVSVTVENASIEAVLAELLTAYDYFFLYKGKRKELQATWIYPSGIGETISLNFPEESKKINNDDFYSSNSSSKVLAIQLSASNYQNENNLVNEALVDEDPDIRTTAILSAQENDISLPKDILIEMAKKDTSPLVRSAALNALAMNTELSDEEIIDLAEAALKDPDEAIREEAEAIIDGIEENNFSEESS